MSRRRKALYLFIGLAVVMALLAAKMVAQVRRGEDLFWLAELWAPAAVFSIGLVTGIEFLMTPSHPSAPVAPAPVHAAAVPAAPKKRAKSKAPARKSVKKRA